MIDAAKFGLFACMFSTGYKLILCALRRLGFHNDKINAPIAGFISAFSLVFDVKQRKNFIMILILSRTIDAGINIAEDRKLIRRSKYKYVVIWVLMTVFCQSRFAIMSDTLNPGMYKFYKKWSMATKADL